MSATTPVVSLGEGDTPLLRSESLSDRTGAHVFLKYEGLNPTGSFKDRGMTLAVSKAVEAGAGAVVCASTGNTSASAAAYAAKAGLVCAVLVPEGFVALGKLAQALVHGARVVEIEGNFDVALTLTKEIARSGEITLVNSVNPHRIEGQKTAAFEIVEALGGAPDLNLIPVGNAGNITAYWKGYREALEAGWSETTPAMHGFQAEGAAPIVTGVAVAEPDTIATAIRIGNPASWEGANEAVSASNGSISAVSDPEILEAYSMLAREGIFVEPASAASVAGLLKMSSDKRVPAGARVVCILTGHGLKDPERALAMAPDRMKAPAELDPIRDQLGLD